MNSLQLTPPAKSTPTAKAVCCAAGIEEQGALLDSGATHSVVSPKEALQLSGPAESCEVSLAGDVRCTWQKTPGGTLVVPKTDASKKGDASQTLVPLRAVVTKLGCKLTWSRSKGLRLQHPKRGLLPTRIVNGCPQLPNEVAIELVKELELCNKSGDQVSRQELYQAVLMDHLCANPARAFQDYLTSGTKVRALQAMLASAPFREFTALSQRLAVNAPVDDAMGWEALKDLPLPRRCRKRLFRSPWVVNFGNPPSTFFKQAIRSKGYEVLEIRQCVEESWVSLLWGALSGRVASVLSVTDCTGEEEFASSLRPLWLWSVASVGQTTCLRQWNNAVEGGFDVFGKDFEGRFQQWSGCQLFDCGAKGIATNMDLSHLPLSYPEGAQPPLHQVEE